MWLIGVRNLKEIDKQKGYLYSTQSCSLKWCDEEEICEENWAIFKNKYLVKYVAIEFIFFNFSK